MFKRLLSTLIEAVLPADKIVALENMAASSAQEEYAVKRSEALYDRLLDLANARGQPGVDDAGLRVALALLTEQESRGVWSKVDLPPVSQQPETPLPFQYARLCNCFKLV